MWRAICAEPEFNSGPASYYFVPRFRLPHSNSHIPIMSEHANRRISNKWKAILVRDDAGVERLNMLLDQGWYLESIELPDLPYLIFAMTSEDLGEPAGNRPAVQSRRRSDPLVLVLTRGGRHCRQRGMILQPDEQGYVDLGTLSTGVHQELGRVHAQAIFGMENGNCLAIVEWK